MTRSHPSLPDCIGRYAVVRRLGQGAMGRVVLANDPVLDRAVAIKMLRDDLGLPEEHRRQLFERMRQEARASARISHPNIVALFDMGEDPVFGLYLVFEYVQGPTLKDRIGTNALAPVEIAAISRQLGSALSTAHEARVLHRDIKPENVILSPTGAKIADFGIARLPESTLTRDGRLLGTPAYSSPEAITHGKFSPASDQFSFAATLYEAISQTRAFPGDDAVAVATLITTEHPAPIAEALGLNPAVDVALFCALSKDPNARFPSCEQFGNALADALSLSQSPRPRQSVADSQRGGATRDRELGGKTLRVIAGAATLGALVMAAALHLTRRCEGPTLPPIPLDAGQVESTREPNPASTTKRIAPKAAHPIAPPTRADSVASTTKPTRVPPQPAPPTAVDGATETVPSSD